MTLKNKLQMKQIYRFALIPALCLLSFHNGKLYAQAPQKPPRLAAVIHEEYDGTRFKPSRDSTKIHWHDTCGAGFNYFTYASGSIPDYFFASLTDTPATTSVRAYHERRLQPFDTMSTYAPSPSGTGYLPTPSGITAQTINNRNMPQNILIQENGTAVSREELFYDASGNWKVSRRYNTQTPTGLAPTPNNIDSFTYDNNGNLVFVKYVDALTTPPYVARTSMRTYDNNNRILKVKDSIRFGASDPYQAYSGVTYEYNSSGQLISVTTEVAPVTTGVLVNQFWEGRTYNSSNRVETHTFREWSGTAWDTTQRYSYSYASVTGNLETVFILQGPSFDTTWRVQWHYGSNNRWDSVISYRRIAGQWLRSNKVSYLYNDFGQITYIDDKSGWNPATNTWYYLYGDRKARCYYESVPTSVKEKIAALPFSVYPNPTSNKEGLHIRSGGEPIRQLSVYNISGSLLIRQTVNNPAKDIVFDLGPLASGTYILHVSGEKSKGSTKITVR